MGEGGGLLEDIVEVVSFDDRVVGFHGWECCVDGGGGQLERRGCTLNGRAVLGATIRAAAGLGRDYCTISMR
ncbi:MAG: hypothetical protein RI897_2191 [Verrucomicrobiota bacterium]|jgi:hypothetical protein